MIGRRAERRQPNTAAGCDAAEPKIYGGRIDTADERLMFLPGVGQIYNGDFLRGIFWLIITPGMWLGTGGMLGWVCHLIAAYTAHGRARKLEFA
jgi:hypothetical protein